MPTSMNRVLSEAIANLEVAIEESHAVVTHDQLPTVLGDESQLIQLFQNLLGNAIKFRGDDAPMIHVGVEETKDGWVFSVRDNGSVLTYNTQNGFLPYFNASTRAMITRERASDLPSLKR